MRKNESALVEESLHRLGLELKVVNAAQQFFEGKLFFFNFSFCINITIIFLPLNCNNYNIFRILIVNYF